MILVSACLLGVSCRYDGGNCKNEEVIRFLEDGEESFIPICPEQLGGLKTPRNPSVVPRGGEKVVRSEGRVVMKDVGDVTSNFLRGAEEALRLAETFNAEKAILKSESPSCGKKSFPKGHGEKGEGPGVTAALLMRNGLDVVSEKEI